MSKKAFTLIELLVVIAIIALLLAIIMPSLKKARAKAGELACRAHLRSLALAAAAYAQDNDGQFVDCHAPSGSGSYAVYVIPDTVGKWLGAGNFFKLGLIEDPEIFYCPGNTNKTLQYGRDHPDPSDKGGGWPIGEIPENLFPGQKWVQTTYHYRSLWTGSEWRAVNSTKDDRGTAFMADMFADPERGVDYHHKDRYNVVYVDTHCEAVVDKEEEIKNFNDGVKYHADHAKQDKVWKRYFDLAGTYPEK